MRTKSVRAGVSRAKFRNGPTLDETKFHIFGVISVCRSIVEKRKSGGMPEDAEVARKKRETRYVDVRVRTRKQIARRKVFHPSFRAFPCRILAKSGPGITSFESTTNKPWSLRCSLGLG